MEAEDGVMRLQAGERPGPPASAGAGGGGGGWLAWSLGHPGPASASVSDLWPPNQEKVKALFKAT